MYGAESLSSLTAQIGAAVEHGPGDARARQSGNDRLTNPPCCGKGSGAGTFCRLWKIPAAPAACCELLIPMETNETDD